MPDALHGFGTEFQRGNGDGPPETFTKVGKVLDISGPALTRETVDTTDQDSVDRWREFIGGLRDGGEVTFGLHFLPSDVGHKALLTDLQTDAPKNYKLVFPDVAQTTWAFRGLVTAIGPSAPFADKLTADVTVKVVGKPTFPA